VISGDPGIGKTSLLGYARGRAGSMTVLDCQGVEAEAGLPFAGLSSLFAPVLHLAADLPSPQAEALAGALALGPPAPGDPFAVAAATLSVLGSPEHNGCLVLVDDAHWLDEESLSALTFAARRLQTEGVVILFAVRTGEPDPLSGHPLERIELTGLDLDSARELLSRGPRPIAGEVTRALHEASAGNPLVLTEVPAMLSAAQVSGHEPLEGPLPIAHAIELAFGQRIEPLSAEAKTALLVAAAADSPAVAAIEGALGELRVGPAALEELERERLVTLSNAQLRFAHPLLRSAVYHSASGAERRAAHGALAAALDAERSLERRALHLAAATMGTDARAAKTVEAAALKARERGAPAVAARNFERAAQLSASEGERARRLLEAARDWAMTANGERASTLLTDALERAEGTAERAEIQRLRGYVELRAGRIPAALALLRSEADRAEDVDPASAAALLCDAAVTHMLTGDMAALRSESERARRLAAGHEPTVEALATLIYAEALVAIGETEEGLRLLSAGEPLVSEPAPAVGAAEAVGMAGHCLMWVEEFERSGEVLETLVDRARESSAVGVLIYPLAAQAQLLHRLGHWWRAISLAAESERLARDTGQVGLLALALGVRARIEGSRGDEGACRAHAEEALAITRALGLDAVGGYSVAALGALELALGNAVQAIRQFTELRAINEAAGGDEPGWLVYHGDFAEACLVADQPERAEPILRDLERRVRKPGRWAQAVLDRLRGLQEPGDGFVEHFEQALRHHQGLPMPFEVARTRLLYGERLAKAGHHDAAQLQLSQAAEAFDALGADAWLGRARAASGADGAAPSRPTVSTAAVEQLTSQEQQVAFHVAQGLTNKEVAAALFLSPKTIEYHLSSIYRKLDIRSRTQLARLL